MKKSNVGIATVVIAEAVVKIIKTFSECQRLQQITSCVRNLTLINIGTEKATEAGGIEVLLVVVTQHLGSAILYANGKRMLCI